MKSINLLGATLLASTTLMGAGSAFAQTSPDPASATTDVAATLQLPDGGGTNPLPPEGGSGGGENTGDNPSGTFGIAYHPTKFEFETTTLKETGSQEIALAAGKGNAQSFHLGVKDKTRTTDQWNVTAKLTGGSIATIPGLSIFLAGSSEVKINNNTAEGPYQENQIVADPTQAVTGQTNVNITSSASSSIMEANVDKQHNATYDWALGEVKLKLADAGQVKAGAHTGAVTWTLANGPMGVE